MIEKLRPYPAYKDSGVSCLGRVQQPLRTLEQIRGDILALEKETEGLLREIIGGGAS